MEQTYKDCQSCAMPMEKSPNGDGTNADGSISKMYCAYCYEDGKFKQPDWTMTQMRDFVKIKMKELGFPVLLVGLFAKRIPKLKRWDEADLRS